MGFVRQRRVAYDQVTGKPVYVAFFKCPLYRWFNLQHRAGWYDPETLRPIQNLRQEGEI